MAIKTLTNKNTPAAQRAGMFSGHHFLRPLAQWFFCALPLQSPQKPEFLHNVDLLFVYFLRSCLVPQTQVSVFTGKQFLNRRRTSSLTQFQ